MEHEKQSRKRPKDELTAEERLLAAIFGARSSTTEEFQSSPDECADRQSLEYESYKLLKEQIDDVLNTLSERDRHVIVSRFGLEDGIYKSLAETGRTINCSKSTVYRIEKKALKKNPSTPKPSDVITM